MNKLIIGVVALFVLMWFVAPIFGVSGSLNVLGFALPMTLLLAGAILITADFFGFMKLFPIPLKKNIMMIVMIALWVGVGVGAGWLPSNLGTASVVVTGDQVSTAECAASISDEIRGTASTLDVNAWDQESNTPYSSAIDLTTNCHYYRNGDDASDYIGPSADTSAEELSGFAVGDTLYAYCGGTSYYSDAIEGECIRQQRQSINIDSHAICPEANLQITVYDDTGSSTLTAGTANEDDYTMSLGAGEETAVHVKLKVNVANKAYDFCAWGVAELYNISSVEPQNVEATYSKVGTPEHMRSVALQPGTDNATITKDYRMFKASSPIRLHEWDYLKEQFVVESDATSDPNGGGGLNTMDGFAIIAKDCTYSRGGDGSMYYEFYGRDTSESDVGLDETEVSPLGKQTGVLVEVA